jgi:putative SOS response-associated peptidase YedK
MCGRFTISVAPSELAELMGLAAVPDVRPRYNVAPSQSVLAVRLNAENKREAVELKWGLVPSWAEDVRIGYKMINARGETIAEKPSFREAFRRRRCLIPADGFFEWKVEGKKKIPYRFHQPNQKPFLFAGLWERRELPGEPVLETCTIVTTTANEVVRPFHERMPVILTDGAADRWLTPGLISPTDAEKLITPAPDGFLIADRVSDRVNSPRIDDPSCIEPITSEA